MLYSFDFPNLFTDDEIDKLSEYARTLYRMGFYKSLVDIDQKFVDEVVFHGDYEWERQGEGLHGTPGTSSGQLPDEIHWFLVDLESRYNTKGSYFSMVQPNDIVEPHIDRDWRKCNLMVPLTPIHAPIVYYDESGNILETVNYDRPILSNTTVSHGVVNNGFRRFTYQCNFFEGIETTLGVLNGN